MSDLPVTFEPGSTCSATITCLRIETILMIADLWGCELSFSGCSDPHQPPPKGDVIQWDRSVFPGHVGSIGTRARHVLRGSMETAHHAGSRGTRPTPRSVPR